MVVFSALHTLGWLIIVLFGPGLFALAALGLFMTALLVAIVVLASALFWMRFGVGVLKRVGQWGRQGAR